MSRRLRYQVAVISPAAMSELTDDDNSHCGDMLAMIERCRVRNGQLTFAIPDVKTINESR